MIRSQCWFTFDFILHQIFWSPVLNDVKQLLIAAIMPSKVRFFHSGSYLGDRRWTRHSTWCSILKENSIKSKELTFLTSLDTLTFHRGLASWFSWQAFGCWRVLRTHLNELVQQCVLLISEGRVTFCKGHLPRSQIVGKVPSGLSSDHEWRTPVWTRLEVIVERIIPWFPSSS